MDSYNAIEILLRWKINKLGLKTFTDYSNHCISVEAVKMEVLHGSKKVGWRLWPISAYLKNPRFTPNDSFRRSLSSAVDGISTFISLSIMHMTILRPHNKTLLSVISPLNRSKRGLLDIKMRVSQQTQDSFQYPSLNSSVMEFIQVASSEANWTIDPELDLVHLISQLTMKGKEKYKLRRQHMSNIK